MGSEENGNVTEERNDAVADKGVERLDDVIRESHRAVEESREKTAEQRRNVERASESLQRVRRTLKRAAAAG
jgi:hypothetical protein